MAWVAQGGCYIKNQVRDPIPFNNVTSLKGVCMPHIYLNIPNKATTVPRTTPDNSGVAHTARHTSLLGLHHSKVIVPSYHFWPHYITLPAYAPGCTTPGSEKSPTIHSYHVQTREPARAGPTPARRSLGLAKVAANGGRSAPSATCPETRDRVVTRGLVVQGGR